MVTVKKELQKEPIVSLVSNEQNQFFPLQTELAAGLIKFGIFQQVRQQTKVSDLVKQLIGIKE
jgi:hypothetical protein